MKKFLHLKRSIVDSKNQPTIMQTYLDTIRSSCYKLATPNVSPKLDKKNKQNFKNLQEYSLKANENDMTNDQKIINKSNKNHQILRFLSEKQSEQKEGQYQQFQSKCIWRKSPNRILQSFSPKITRNDPDLQICQTNPEIEQIFQTLSSHCKSDRNESFTTQKQIIETIMKSLELLNKKKQFQQSVQLIKNIIMSLQVGQECRKVKFEAIASHSQVKDMDYIIQSHQNDIGINSQQNSHFKSCMQLQDQKVKNQVKEDNEKRFNKINLSESQQEEYLNYLKKQQSTNQIEKTFKIKYSVYKNNKKTHQGQSIYIQDPQSEDGLIYPQAQKTSRQYYQQNKGERSYSMESQEINQWKNDQLYCIQQKQEEEDYKSCSLSSIVPEETIQFKKILYMLDSESTNKKPEKNINPIKKANIRFKTRSTSNHSASSVRSLFNQSISIDEQIPNKDLRFKTQVSIQGSPNTTQQFLSQQTVKTTNSRIQDQNQSQIKEIQINHQIPVVKNQGKDTCKSKKSLKQTQALQLKSKNPKNIISTNTHCSTTKIDKSKQLKQIVSMLSNKYNRTIKLNKN